MSNQSAPPPQYPKGKSSWEVFDSLPRDHKEFLWNEPTGKMGISGAMPSSALTQAVKKFYSEWPLETFRTYGPDHPQAKAPYMRPGDELDFGSPDEAPAPCVKRPRTRAKRRT